VGGRSVSKPPSLAGDVELSVLVGSEWLISSCEAQDFSAGWIDVEVEDSSVQLNEKAVVRIFSHPSALGREEFQNVA